MLRSMTVVVIGGVVAVIVLAVVLLLAAKNRVEVIDAPRPPPAGAVKALAPQVARPADQVEGVAALVREGRKIEAIKRYRDQTGVSLKEAKEAVDALEDGRTAPQVAPPAPRRITAELAIDDAELRRHLSSGRLIDAIKRYRELTGLGLKESKDAIESLRDSMKS